MRRGLGIHVSTAAIAGIACATAVACGSAGVRAPHHAEKAVPLSLVRAKLPPLPVRRFHTSGTYPQFRGSAAELGAVNDAARSMILADERAYAAFARKNSSLAAPSFYGIYRIMVDRSLVSASSIVVSMLLPTARALPGQVEDRTWIAGTFEVPSGRRVEITDLFSDPPIALRVLAREWTRRIRQTAYWQCVRHYLQHYRPTARNYSLFALTRTGVAVGFRYEPTCNRTIETIPYGSLRPYLSARGKQLVAGVRSPS